MRHLVYILTLVMAMVFAMPAFAEQTSGESSAKKEDLKLDGQAWTFSTEDEKLAFLLGVEMTLATEQALVDRFNSRERPGKKKHIRSSPFVRGWHKAFNDMSRREIAAEIDAYIAAHPDARAEHVFAIIWRGLIVPKAGINWPKEKPTAWNY